MRNGMKIALVIAAVLVVLGGVVGGMAISRGASWRGALEAVSSIPMKYTGDPEPGPAGAYSANGSYSVPAEGIRSVEVNWDSGWVDILTDKGDDIRFIEQGKDITEDTALRWYSVNGVLTIRYCRNGQVVGQNKSLTLTLPASLAGDMDRLTVDVASADVTLNGAAIRAKELVLDGASGNVTAEIGRADAVTLGSASGNHTFTGSFDRLEADGASSEMMVSGTSDASYIRADTSSGNVQIRMRGRVELCELDTASGRAEFYGEAGELEIDTASGDVTVDSTGFLCPNKLDADTASGDVTLRVGADAGFVLDFDTASGKLTSDLGFAFGPDGEYIAGNGAARFEVDTASGDLHIS